MLNKIANVLVIPDRSWRGWKTECFKRWTNTLKYATRFRREVELVDPKTDEGTREFSNVENLSEEHVEHMGANADWAVVDDD